MKKAKVVRKTLRTERDSARKAIEGLQRLKMVLPMVEAQREAIDAAIASLRFAWRNHTLETKIGDTLTLSGYADSGAHRFAPMSWRKIKIG